MARQATTNDPRSGGATNGSGSAAPRRAQAAAGPEAPRAIGPAEAPRGRRLSGNLGPGTLNPGAGKRVQRTGEPLYCGTITGRIFGVTEHPNTRDPKRISRRFAGQFILVRHDGSVVQGAECYLTGTVERAVKAALDLRDGHGEPVPVSIEVWCEPDEEGRNPSPLGYSYVSYDRTSQRANDPLLALAYESGILERPAQGALPSPELPDDVDPETGEIRQQPSAAA
jgi:hypothetical protein